MEAARALERRGLDGAFYLSLTSRTWTSSEDMDVTFSSGSRGTTEPSARAFGSQDS